VSLPLGLIFNFFDFKNHYEDKIEKVENGKKQTEFNLQTQIK
jgi:hypothetical protein